MGEAKAQERVNSREIPWLLSSGWRFFFTTVLILLVPTLLLVIALSAAFHKALENGAINENETALRLGSRIVHHHFEALTNQISDASVNSEFYDAISRKDLPKVRGFLRRFVQKARVDCVIITNANREELLRFPESGGSLDKDHAGSDWYNGLSSGKSMYVSKVYHPGGDKRRFAAAVAAPISQAGYIVAETSLEPLTSWLLTVRPTLSGSIYLVDHSGKLSHGIDRFDSDIILRRNQVIADALKGASGSTRAEDPVTGDESFMSYGQISSIGWVIIALQPAYSVFSPARQIVTSLIILGILSFIVISATLFVTLMTVRNYQSRLNELHMVKEQFFHMMVHDIRNPLASAVGWTKLVKSLPEQRDEKVRQYVNGIENAWQQLQLLVDTTLDMMRAEDKKLAINLSRANIGALLQERIDQYLGAARSAKLTLSFNPPAEVLEADMDARLIGRVVDNLLTNAIKYTLESKSVTVSANRLYGGKVIAISVRDEGSGIPPEYHDQIFLKYQGIELKKPRYAYGSGLGLYYSKMIVEMHGGKILLQSVAGHGSTFTLELPAATSVAPAPKQDQTIRH